MVQRRLRMLRKVDPGDDLAVLGTVAAAYDDDRALGIARRVQADGAEEQTGEAAESSVSHHDLVRLTGQPAERHDRRVGHEVRRRGQVGTPLAHLLDRLFEDRSPGVLDGLRHHGSRVERDVTGPGLHGVHDPQ